MANVRSSTQPMDGIDEMYPKKYTSIANSFEKSLSVVSKWTWHWQIKECAQHCVNIDQQETVAIVADKKNRNAGSSLDALLVDEGIYEEVTIEALKRVIAWQLAREMEKQQLSKTELARRMNTSRSSLERLLDPEHSSLTLATIVKAARSLGKRVEFRMIG